MNQNKRKILIVVAAATAMGMLTFCGIVYLIAANFKTILPFVRENKLIVALGLLLAILLPYAVAGAIVHYAWQRVNRKRFALNLDDEQKRVFMRHYGVADDKDLIVPPNLFESLMLGPSSGTDIVRNFFLDGPHLVDSGLRGLVRSRSIFRFAVLVSDLNETIREGAFRSLPQSSLLLGGVFVYFSLLIWGLFPYFMAILRNFTLLNDYVSNFTLADAYRLKKAGRDEDVEIVEDLRSTILPWLRK